MHNPTQLEGTKHHITDKAERTTTKRLHHHDIREWTVLLRTRTVRFCAKKNPTKNKTQQQLKKTKTEN